MSKAPAFQFYAKDILVDCMQWDDAMVGLHTRLMCIQWSNRGIEVDPKGVPKGLSKKQKSIYEKIKHKYKLVDGKLYNKRIEETRAEQEENRKSSSERGKKGADARWHKHDLENASSNGTSIAQGLPNIITKHDSSSSTSSSITKYINIGLKKIFQSPSEYLSEVDLLFFESRMMTLFSGVDKTEILRRFDEEYNMYNFNDLNHFRNACKSVVDKIKTEKEKKTYKKQTTEAAKASDDKIFDLSITKE